MTSLLAPAGAAELAEAALLAEELAEATLLEAELAAEDDLLAEELAAGAELEALAEELAGAVVAAGALVAAGAAVGGAAVGTGVGAGPHAARATRTSSVRLIQVKRLVRNIVFFSFFFRGITNVSGSIQPTSNKQGSEPVSCAVITPYATAVEDEKKTLARSKDALNRGLLDYIR